MLYREMKMAIPVVVRVFAKALMLEEVASICTQRIHPVSFGERAPSLNVNRCI